MLQAATNDLVAAGQADLIFFAKTLDQADMTLWRSLVMKITVFALEPVEIDAQNAVKYGGRSLFNFPRQGDLAWHTFAVITVPGLVALTPVSGGGYSMVVGEHEPYYTNNFGMWVLQESILKIGAAEIHHLYAHFMNAQEEVCGQPGKRLVEMTGKYDDESMLQLKSRQQQTFYVPLPFYYTKNTGLALPLASLQFHPVQVQLHFAKLLECIRVPEGFPASTGTDVYKRDETTLDSDYATMTSAPDKVTENDIQCYLLFMCVYLDADERSKFAHGQFEQVTEEVQLFEHTVNHQTSGSNLQNAAPVQFRVTPTFNNIVKEYIIMFLRNDFSAQNDHFNYAGYINPVTGLWADPVVDLTIKFNNQPRVDTQGALFYRLVEPWMHHTSIPRQFIYVWSYATEPQDFQVTGGANHSRIDNVSLEFNLNAQCFAETDTMNCMIFAVSLNLVRFKYGLISKKM
jgi:hypothetical protein